MRSTNYWPARPVLDALEQLFGDSGYALESLGVKQDIEIAELYEADPQPGVPLEARLVLLKQRLEEYLVQMGAEAEELGREEETRRLRSEAVGLLLALREIHKHAREVFG